MLLLALQLQHRFVEISWCLSVDPISQRNDELVYLKLSNFIYTAIERRIIHSGT
jgi:hypothetical protein